MTLVIAGVVLFPLGLLGLVLVMASLEDGLVDAAAESVAESGDSLPEVGPQPAAAHQSAAVAARPLP